MCVISMMAELEGLGVMLGGWMEARAAESWEHVGAVRDTPRGVESLVLMELQRVGVICREGQWSARDTGQQEKDVNPILGDAWSVFSLLPDHCID